MESHLKAFPTTPACMNLHYTEYGFADRVLEQNGVWLRRDSFQAHMNTEEYRWIHRGAKKGAMIWERSARTSRAPRLCCLRRPKWYSIVWITAQITSGWHSRRGILS